MVRLDAHQHFWRRARGDYHWLRDDLPALAPLRRDFEPGDLAPLLDDHGIQRTVLVQAADSTAETDFMLALAEHHPFIAAVVGWVDLSADSATARLEDWASRAPRLKGIRPMLQDLPQSDWIEHGPTPRALAALAALGLRFDALVKTAHLPSLARFARRHPDLPIVIDHAAKPPFAAGWKAPEFQAWRSELAALAAQPRIHCKFSGLLTEMGEVAGEVKGRAKGEEMGEKKGEEKEQQGSLSVPQALARLRPVWDELLERFGPGRLMWGSDWPVLNLAADYHVWHTCSEILIGGLSADEQALIWSGTASRFYGLPE